MEAAHATKERLNFSPSGNVKTPKPNSNVATNVSNITTEQSVFCNLSTLNLNIVINDITALNATRIKYPTILDGNDCPENIVDRDAS